MSTVFDPDTLVQILDNSSNPASIISDIFRHVKGEMPLDGILVGFLDNATFTTYWLHHHGNEEAAAVPRAQVHTGPEIRDFMDRSTWNQEGNWIRIVNTPSSTVVGTFFARHMNSDQYSFIHVRSSYDANKRGHFLFYTKKQDVYTKEHIELVAQFKEQIILLTSVIIKDFLLQQLQSVCTLSSEPQPPLETPIYDLVASSTGMVEILRKMELVSQLPTPVLLTGETGVGKEMFANFIHWHSPRKNMPFIKVNCGAIAPTLLDSELFGHEKGAFTGALTQKAGYFEQANNGTLMLDEVGEMPPDVQIRLLRVLQSGTFTRIGGNKELHVDTRVIAATNCDMAELLCKGTFREDLYYRLNVYNIHIPPLRDRAEDMPLLTRILIRKIAKKLKIDSPPVVRQENIDELTRFPWKGNVRELQNAIESSLINYMVSPSGNGFWITPDMRHYGAVPDNQPAVESAAILPEAPVHAFSTEGASPISSFDDAVRKIIVDALQACSGKIHGSNGAAELLDMKESTLWGKLNKYGIKPSQFRS